MATDQRERDQKAFVDGLEVWHGFPEKDSIALTWIEGLRLQSGYVVMRTVGDHGDEEEFAITLDALISRWADLHSYDHPSDFAEEQASMVASLERALAVVKASKAGE